MFLAFSRFLTVLRRGSIRVEWGVGLPYYSVQGGCRHIRVSFVRYSLADP